MNIKHETFLMLIFIKVQKSARLFFYGTIRGQYWSQLPPTISIMRDLDLPQISKIENFCLYINL